EKKLLFMEISFQDGQGKEIYSKKERIKTSEFDSGFKIDRPQLWSPETPDLYNLQLKLTDEKGRILDSFSHKVGFRTFDASPDGFRLNGQKLKLIGVNRHQDWEGLGNAVPVEKQLQDMVKIKEMGANFVRLAHYPQDEAIYKAADSLGIILWSEIPVVNKVPATKAYDDFKEHALQMQREQIAQHINHPSLIFLGYMNEIFLRMVFDKKEGKERKAIVDNTLELAHELENLTRKLAPDRITVMAVHGDQIYNETGIADIPMVLGWNLYFGWYGGEVDDLGTFLDKEHQEHPNRPLIISEYGVGADDRLHSQQPERFDFTEEYQLKYHQAYLRQLLARDYVVGMTAWNFADFGSEFRGDTRPHINEKGLLNYDRTPKNIYYWYKAMLKPSDKFSRFFREVPVYISSSSLKDLKVISNQPAYVELNGEKIAKGRPQEGIIDFRVNLKRGKNELKVFNADQKLQDTMQLEWQRPDFSASNYLALNFGTNASFTSENGQIWIPAENSGIVETEGETKKIKSSTNIRETEEEPIYQTGLSKIESIRLQVPSGKYKVRLYFANLGKDKALVYELNNKDAADKTSSEKLNLSVNGKSVEMPKIEEFHKGEKTLEIKTSGEINIEAPAGKAFAISGILLEKTD
ncbi:MAG: glycoside hydrolase family 2 TIM barrel-domain containing protein, partial [Salegentibacter sp.]